uniref:Tc3 transposase DNA binding domain-containing protein n=1 Tax=Globisporangium ultimum (strain ATCC 200006 / CBS 805.95 / DAOM BR144) TaxID=431595 RepID=K3XCW5_GLOUD
MPRGLSLSDYEQGLISAMNAAGRSQKEIAVAIRRSKTVVQTYLRDPGRYNITRRSRRRSSLPAATVRRIVRSAKTGKYSLSQLVRALDLTVSARSVRRLLSRKDTLCYVK